MFKSFVKEAIALQTEDWQTPPDYLTVKIAVTKKFPMLKLSNTTASATNQSRMARFREAAKAEVGPASGAVLGAGVANAYGVNPLAGAAAGYGIGAIPEIIHGIRHRVK